MFSYKIDPRGSILGWITTQVEVYEKSMKMCPRLLVAMGTAAILDFPRSCLRVFF